MDDCVDRLTLIETEKRLKDIALYYGYFDIDLFCKAKNDEDAMENIVSLFSTELIEK